MTPEIKALQDRVEASSQRIKDSMTDVFLLKVFAELQAIRQELAALRRPDTAADICERGAMPKGRRYSVEPHGAGYAIYQGRDATHHGLNLGYLTEFDAGLPALIERAMNGERTTGGTPDASAIREQGE
jgi:hypothetical protein